MISQIISHTPTWVFVLFFVLVHLGIQQAQTRTVTLKRLVILPVAMLGLSVSGVWSTFNHSSDSLICWGTGLAISTLIAFMLTSVRNVRHIPETQSLEQPGSWLPLCLMMAIFFTKYAVGVSTAHHPEFLESSEFIAIASVLYGFWSGMFVGRTLKMVGSQGKELVTQMFKA